MVRFSLTFSDNYAHLPFTFQNQPAEGAATCLISTRSAGAPRHCEKEAAEAQKNWYRRLGLDPDKIFTCAQVHGQDVVPVNRNSSYKPSPGDGLVSRDSQALLAVTVADCLPIFLWDQKTGAFGVVHSGWRGTGIAVHALKRMKQEWQVKPEQVLVILGPGIQVCCYRVDEARARFFEKTFGPGGAPSPGDAYDEKAHPPRLDAEKYPLGPVVQRSKGEWRINLQAANAHLLVSAGVDERNIAVCETCTFTDERLGSFRREGPAYTRMTALIGFFTPPKPMDLKSSADRLTK
jgi:YfiH family protein